MRCTTGTVAPNCGTFGKEQHAKPTRLNDPITKRDVKGGHRTVIGVIRARPENNKQKKEPQP